MRRTLAILLRNPLSLLGLALIALVVLSAIFADFITPFPTHAGAVVELAPTNRVAYRLGHTPVESGKIAGSIPVPDRLLDDRLQPINDLVDATHHVSLSRSVRLAR